MRMVGADGFAQVLMREMCVNLGGVDFLVSEHLLHSAEVGTIGDKLGGETVAKAMRRYVFLNAGFLDSLFEEHKDVIARQVRSQPIDEDIILLAAAYTLVRADSFDVLQHEVQGGLIDGHPTLLVAFAGHQQAFVVGVDV